MMITSLAGKIKEIETHSVSLEVNGIGFGVFVARTDSFKLDTLTSLYIVMYWNQEQGPQLFGFNNKEEKKMFSLITSCSGFGPRLALTIIAQISPGQLIQAIISNDIGVLSSISGIGKKKAEQIILQLKDKVLQLSLADNQQTGNLLVIKQVAEALLSLGYNRTEANYALEHMTKESATASFDELLRKALALLSKSKKI